MSRLSAIGSRSRNRYSHVSGRVRGDRLRLLGPGYRPPPGCTPCPNRRRSQATDVPALLAF
jgi:hypothetical protein